MAEEDSSFEGIDTGFKAIVGSPSRVEIIDSLLSIQPNRQFNIAELSRMSDVSRASVQRNIDVLLQLNLICEVHYSNNRYTINDDSEIYTKLVELDGIANNNGPET